MEYQGVFVRRFSVLICFCLGLLSGCKSIPTSPAPQPIDPQKLALEQAFNARGFTLSPLGNINYLGTKQCSNLELQAHRGSIRFPENSLDAVIDALDNQFDVIEIDVRLTRDDVWVVHHDRRTGRETGTIDNKRRKISSIRYEKEWGYLRHRNMQTGALTNTIPPSFRQLAQVFSRYAHGRQKLNIEIKNHAGNQDLDMLDYLAFNIIGHGRYFYSSLELDNLKKMRQINDDVFLSFIQSPAKASMNKLAADMKRGAGQDPVFLRNQSMLEDIQGYANRLYREKRYDSSAGLNKLKKALKSNFGIALDIRHYQQRVSGFKSVAHNRSIPVSSYTINGHDYHEQSLLGLNRSLLPDSVIIDDSLYGFCSRFALPPMLSYQGSTDLTRKLATLPKDLDLNNLSSLETYWPNGLYPAVDGKIKSFKTDEVANNAKASPSGFADGFVPVIIKTQAGPRESQTQVDITTDEAVKIELRRSQQD